MRYSFTRTSSNVKTGPIPVTMTSEASCPQSCTLKDAGCYARFSYVGMQWSKLNKPEHGYDLTQLSGLIQALPIGQIWRHNVAGDMALQGTSILDVNVVRELTLANQLAKAKGFTYTHCSPIGTTPAAKHNRLTIRKAIERGFIINVSCETLEQVDQVVGMGLPAVVLLSEDAPNKQKTPEGNTVIKCPATYTNTNCSLCKLCANSAPERATIGFPVHGAGKKMARKVINIEVTT